MELVVDTLYYGLYIVTSLILSCIVGLGILIFCRLTYEQENTNKTEPESIDSDGYRVEEANDDSRRNSEADIPNLIQGTRDTEIFQHSELENTVITEPETTDSDILENYQTQKIALAVIGRSNMGKSTFINLIRDVDDKSDDYAQTGFGDTTMEVTEYKHPKTENISLWDLPGLGTSLMTKNRFIKEVNLDIFDFFFIFLDSVVMEDDIWLVETLKKRHIPFCFVRSKLDIDIANAKQKGIGQEEVIKVIKEKISKSISANDTTKGSKFFLVSNVKEHFHVGELSSLFRYVANEINACKIEALLFFLPVLNPDIIQMKYEAMEKRINFVAKVAATLSAIPIPLIEIPVNAKLIEKEVSLYIHVFELDADYAKKVPNLKYRVNSKEGFDSLFSLTVEIFRNQAGHIPIVGSVCAAYTSYHYVVEFLRHALNEAMTDALRVYKYFGQTNSKP